MSTGRRIVAALLLAAGLPTAALAVLREVPTAYDTIAAALAAADPGDTIYLRRGIYKEAVVVSEELTLEGEEAAGTRLTGGIQIKAPVTLRRLTVSGTGLTVAAGGSGTIENALFRDVSGTALTVSALAAGTAAGALDVSRNTFYGNGVGVSVGAGREDTTVFANVFAENTTAIEVPAGASTAGLTDNCFALAAGDALVGTGETTGLAFVDAALADRNLHLTPASACANRGAYSGDGADPTPSPVTGVTATSVAAGTVRVEWIAKPAAGVAVDRYLVRFKGTGTGAAYVDAAEVAPAAGDSYAEDLATTPGVPTGVTATPRDRGLRVSWTDDERADGHVVYLGTAPGDYPSTRDAGGASRLDLTGLPNGVRHYAAVSAYAEGNRVYAVVARSSTAGQPESRPSDAAAVALPRAESGLSDPATAVPEELPGYPALEDRGGCFVRAAAEPRARGSAAAALAAAVATVLLAGRRRPRVVAVAAALAAAGLAPTSARAGWAVSAGAGAFYPAEEDWADHYGKRYLPEGKIRAGYLPLPQIEVGADAGFRRDRGQITTTSTGEPLDAAVDQTLSVVPLQAYVLVNLRLSDRQWVVPYAAAGYSRYYYKLEVDGGETVRGHQDGYHARAGLKLLLDPLDPGNAANARGRYGVAGTYLLVEAQKAWVDDRGGSGVDLGGLSYTGGIGIEF